MQIRVVPAKYIPILEEAINAAMRQIEAGDVPAFGLDDWRKGNAIVMVANPQDSFHEIVRALYQTTEKRDTALRASA